VARSFNGTTDRAENLDFVATAATDNYTMALWVNYSSLATDNDLLFYNGSSSSNGWGLRFSNSLGFMTALYGGVAADLGGAAYSTTGTWNHFVLRRSAGTSQIFKEGATFGSTFGNAPVAPTATFEGGIGLADFGGTGAENLPRSVAEAAIWSRALDNDEIAALAEGFAPSCFKTSLVFYAPLIGRASPEPDYARGNNLTLVGTANADHPRIIYPRKRYSAIPAPPPPPETLFAQACL
jgi:hypothetical protein